MEAKTIKKILSKLELMQERKSDVMEWINEINAEEFKYDKKTMLATYKAVQEIAEAATDICAIILKNINNTVNDDYTNIERLQRKKILSRQTAIILKELNGLRNRLVHEYEGIESLTALESIQRVVPETKKFVEEVKKWLKQKK